MKKIAFTLFIILIFYKIGTSQGCGDAGACSINSMKGISTDSSLTNYKNFFKLGTTIGLAQYSVIIISPYIEYSRIITKKLSVSGKFTSSVHYGDITTTYGFSDAYLTANYNVFSSLNIIAGAKFPLTSSNKTKDDLALPMSYQTSLGTTDIIAGISYNKKAITLSFAYQKPITQNNNTFFIDDYPTGSIDTNYKSTNQYYRQDDVLLRISHTHNFKIILISSILPIYHLGNDTYVNKLGMVEEIQKSAGLTLNLNVFLQYKFSETKRLELSVAAPIIARKSRPDGLVAISLGLEYSVLF